MKCRFHFPFEQKPQTTLEFEEINSRDDNVKYRAKIVTKRNDSRINNHQRLQLQGWRANCDIQVVIDHYACVEYLTKYAAKSERKHVGAKPPPKCFVSSWVFHIISHYLKSIDFFYTKLGR